MTGARMTTLAQLRGSIERIETHSDTYAPDRVSLGHAEGRALRSKRAKCRAAIGCSPLPKMSAVVE